MRQASLVGKRAIAVGLWMIRRTYRVKLDGINITHVGKINKRVCRCYHADLYFTTFKLEFGKFKLFFSITVVVYPIAVNDWLKLWDRGVNFFLLPKRSRPEKVGEPLQHDDYALNTKTFNLINTSITLSKNTI